MGGRRRKYDMEFDDRGCVSYAIPLRIAVA